MLSDVKMTYWWVIVFSRHSLFDAMSWYRTFKSMSIGWKSSTRIVFHLFQPITQNFCKNNYLKTTAVSHHRKNDVLHDWGICPVFVLWCISRQSVRWWRHVAVVRWSFTAASVAMPRARGLIEFAESLNGWYESFIKSSNYFLRPCQALAHTKANYALQQIEKPEECLKAIQASVYGNLWWDQSIIFLGGNFINLKHCMVNNNR